VSNINIVEWAAQQASELLTPLGNRWLHTQGVVKRAYQIANALNEEDRSTLIAAAYLHDIGYAPAIRQTDFHPLDGAYYLLSQHQERLASLVAYHSGAEYEASLRGLDTALKHIPREYSAVADALTYADMLIGATGQAVSFDERVKDIFQRYDDQAIVSQAMHRAIPALQATLERARTRLNEIRNTQEP
jgi:hypothetical protein